MIADIVLTSTSLTDSGRYRAKNIGQLIWFSTVTHQPSELIGKLIHEISLVPFTRLSERQLPTLL
jgi:hypothetical protein